MNKERERAEPIQKILFCVGRRGLFTIIFFILFLSFTSATLNVSLSDQGNNVKYKSNGSVMNSGNLEITVYDALTGGNLIYNETFAGVINNGSWNVMIGENSSNNLSLEFGKIYYKDYKINGQDLDFTDFYGNTVERRFFYSPLGDIGGEDVSVLSNLTVANLSVSKNISASTGFFSWLGDLTSRITQLFIQNIDFIGNINGSGNITTTGKIGVGTEYPTNTLDVRGQGNFSGIIFVNNATEINGSTFNLTYHNSIDLLSANVTSINATLNIQNLYNLTASMIANLSISQGGLANYWGSNGSNIYNKTAYIGIGTSSPLSTFQINSSNSRGAFAIYNLTGEASFLHVNGTNGNVGIGIGSPAYLLEIANSAAALNASGMLYVNSSNVGIRTTSPSSVLEIAKVSGKNEVNLSGILYINSTSGKVGIGTSTPTGLGIDIAAVNQQLKLTDTTAGEDDFVFTANSNFLEIFSSTRYLITLHGDSSTYKGRIGIGTSTPSQTLEVAGNTTVREMINLQVRTLPTCATIYNGSIMRNDTGVYGCSTSSVWIKIF